MKPSEVPQTSAEPSADGQSRLILCFAGPGWDSELVSRAAFGIALQRSHHTRVLHLCLVQSEEWLHREADRIDHDLDDPHSPSYVFDLPGHSFAERFVELALLLREMSPAVVVLDNLTRLHPEPDSEPLTLEWFREADREALRQMRTVLGGFDLEMLVVHFIDQHDAAALQSEGFVDDAVRIDVQLLGSRRGGA